MANNVDLTNIQRREPEVFAAGDTLMLERYFPEFPASQGWYLEGVVTDLNGNLVPGSAYQSQPDQDAHQIVVQNWLAGVAEGDYVLAEYAVLPANNVNGFPAERKQVYRGVLTISADLADGLATTSLQTEAQQMIAAIRTTLLALYGRMMERTEAERTAFMLQDIKKMREELAYWKEMRNYEIRMENAANGKPIGNTAIPIMMIG